VGFVPIAPPFQGEEGFRVCERTVWISIEGLDLPFANGIRKSCRGSDSEYLISTPISNEFDLSLILILGQWL
jgi:hypothetical protein